MPFLHFFDGFRTSHEVARSSSSRATTTCAHDATTSCIAAHAPARLTPDHPVLRGTAQNPDVFFQAREAVQPLLRRRARHRAGRMDQLRRAHRPALPPLRLRSAHPRPSASSCSMGSGVGAAQETVDDLTAARRAGRPVKVRLYRPFSTDALRGRPARRPCARSPCSTAPRSRAPSASRSTWTSSPPCARAELGDGALRRTMPRGHRRPLRPVVQGIHPGDGQGGLRRAGRRPSPRATSPSASSTTSPTCACRRPRRSTSPSADEVAGAVFFGLGADGTVGANKNSIKIIGEDTDLYAQGYFVYDSKKSGSMTVSHLRFGPSRSARLPDRRRDFVACHQFDFLEQIDVLELRRARRDVPAQQPLRADEVWDQLPREVQQQIIDKKLRVLRDRRLQGRRARPGMGGRINTSCRPASSRSPACCRATRRSRRSRTSIKKTYGKQGRGGRRAELRRRRPVAGRICTRSRCPTSVTATARPTAVVADDAPDFVKRVTAR